MTASGVVVEGRKEERGRRIKRERMRGRKKKGEEVENNNKRERR